MLRKLGGARIGGPGPLRPTRPDPAIIPFVKYEGIGKPTRSREPRPAGTHLLFIIFIYIF